MRRTSSTSTLGQKSSILRRRFVYFLVATAATSAYYFQGFKEIHFFLSGISEQYKPDDIRTAINIDKDKDQDIDIRPVSPKGLVCIDGQKGRLNNRIIEMLIGMHYATYTNRTFVVQPDLSGLLDMHRLSLLSILQQEKDP